jgi:hypothetical protein
MYNKYLQGQNATNNINPNFGQIPSTFPGLVQPPGTFASPNASVLNGPVSGPKANLVPSYIMGRPGAFGVPNFTMGAPGTFAPNFMMGAPGTFTPNFMMGVPGSFRTPSSFSSESYYNPYGANLYSPEFIDTKG